MSLSRRLLLLGVLAVGAVAAGLAWLRPAVQPPPRSAPLLPASVPPVSPTPPPGVFQRLWSRPVADFQSAALSPDGGQWALIARPKRTVSLWSRSGKLLWQRDAAGMTQTAVSRDGAWTLTWAALDPTQKKLAIRRGKDGAQVIERALDGAVWSVDVAASGKAAVVTTGSRTLLWVALGDRPAVQTRRLSGLGTGLALSADAAMLAVGTWDESGIALQMPTGETLWQYPSDPAARKAQATRLFETQLSANGNWVLGLSCANARQSDGMVSLWRRGGRGTPLWAYALGAETFHPRAQISRDGETIAVTYGRQIARADAGFMERQLLVLDRLGNVRVKTGGLLFTPILIALAPDGGQIIVSDSRRTLYQLDSAGRLTGRKIAFPGLIRQTSLSEDGRSLLVYTGDGTLSLLKLF